MTPVLVAADQQRIRTQPLEPHSTGFSTDPSIELGYRETPLGALWEMEQDGVIVDRHFVAPDILIRKTRVLYFLISAGDNDGSIYGRCQIAVKDRRGARLGTGSWEVGKSSRKGMAAAIVVEVPEAHADGLVLELSDCDFYLNDGNAPPTFFSPRTVRSQAPLQVGDAPRGGQIKELRFDKWIGGGKLLDIRIAVKELAVVDLASEVPIHDRRNNVMWEVANWSEGVDQSFFAHESLAQSPPPFRPFDPKARAESRLFERFSPDLEPKIVYTIAPWIRNRRWSEAGNTDSCGFFGRFHFRLMDSDGTNQRVLQVWSTSPDKATRIPRGERRLLDVPEGDVTPFGMDSESFKNLSISVSEGELYKAGSGAKSVPLPGQGVRIPLHIEPPFQFTGNMAVVADTFLGSWQSGGDEAQVGVAILAHMLPPGFKVDDKMPPGLQRLFQDRQPVPGSYSFSRFFVLEYLRPADGRIHGVIQLRADESQTGPAGGASAEPVLMLRREFPNVGASAPEEIVKFQNNQATLLVDDAHHKIEIVVRRILPERVPDADFAEDESGEGYRLIPDRFSPTRWYYAPRELRFSEYGAPGRRYPNFQLLRYATSQRGSGNASVLFQLGLPADSPALRQRLSNQLLAKSFSLQSLLAGSDLAPQSGDPFDIPVSAKFPLLGRNAVRNLPRMGLQHPVEIQPLPVRASRVRLYPDGRKPLEFHSRLGKAPAGAFQHELDAATADLLESALRTASVRCDVAYEFVPLFYAQGTNGMLDPFLIVNDWLEKAAASQAFSQEEADLVEALHKESQRAASNGYRPRYPEERAKWDALLKAVRAAPAGGGFSPNAAQFEMVRLSANYLCILMSESMRTGTPGAQEDLIRHRYYQMIDAHSTSEARFLNFLGFYPHFSVSASGRSRGGLAKEILPLTSGSKGAPNAYPDGFLGPEAFQKAKLVFESVEGGESRMIASHRVFTQSGMLSLAQYPPDILSSVIMPKTKEAEPAALVLPLLETAEKEGITVNRLEIRPVLVFRNRGDASQSLVAQIVASWKPQPAGPFEPIAPPDLATPGEARIYYPYLQWQPETGWQWNHPESREWIPLPHPRVEFSLAAMGDYKNDVQKADWLNTRLHLWHALTHSSDAQTSTETGDSSQTGRPAAYCVEMPAFEGDRATPYPGEYLQPLRIDLSGLEWSQFSARSRLESVAIELRQGNRIFRATAKPTKDAAGNWAAPESPSWLLKRPFPGAEALSSAAPTSWDDPAGQVDANITFHRAGAPPRSWIYNHDRRTFTERYPKLQRTTVELLMDDNNPNVTPDSSDWK